MMISATLPPFIRKAINQYMKPDHVSIDMVGQTETRTAEK
jgi:hypothetical protein